MRMDAHCNFRDIFSFIAHTVISCCYVGHCEESDFLDEAISCIEPEDCFVAYATRNDMSSLLLSNHQHFVLNFEHSKKDLYYWQRQADNQFRPEKFFEI